MTGAERISIQARAREVADSLRGTCCDMFEFAHDAEINDIDFCSELDSLLELCEGCGWWDDPGEDCCEIWDDEQ